MVFPICCLNSIIHIVLYKPKSNTTINISFLYHSCFIDHTFPTDLQPSLLCRTSREALCNLFADTSCKYFPDTFGVDKISRLVSGVFIRLYRLSRCQRSKIERLSTRTTTREIFIEQALMAAIQNGGKQNRKRLSL